MKWLLQIKRLFRDLFRKGKMDADMNEELRSHIEMRTLENIDSGMNPEEARYAAMRRFGWSDSIKEECRERRSFLLLENLIQDVRFAVRQLMKSPGFTSVAVLTLALGIGAITAIFSVVNAVLLRPLPYATPERIVTIAESNSRLGLPQYTVSLANYLDWREKNTVFDEMAAVATGGMMTLQCEGEPAQARTAYVSANLFPLLGVRPLLGRAFLVEEEQRGRAATVLLSERIWRGRFGADPKIAGKTVQLNGRGFTVAGVMPEQLRLFEPSRLQGWESGVGEADVWRPLVIWPDKLKWRNMREFLVLGRLKQGISLKQAQENMTAIVRRLEQEFPDSNAGWSVVLSPWQQEITARARPALAVLLGAGGLALLIAVANMAGLLLTRMIARRREFGVRLALGASFWRLARQLVAEALLLAFIGGAAGLIASGWVLRLLAGVLPSSMPRASEVGIDISVLGFTMGVTLLSSFLFVLGPLLRLGRVNMIDALKRESRCVAGFGGWHLRSCLVVAQLALVTVLTTGAGLLTQSFWRLCRVDPGFNPERIAAADVSLGGINYSNGGAMTEFVGKLLPRLALIPGAESVATVNGLPLDGNRENMDISVDVGEGTVGGPNEKIIAGLRQASADYFTTLGMPVIQGRYFNSLDRETAPPVAIVNECFVRRFLSGGQAVGKHISSPDFGSQPCQIVGVVKDVKHGGLDMPARPEVFRPHMQSCFSILTVVVKSRLGRDEAFNAMKAAVASVDRNAAVYNARTLTGQVAASGAPRRFAMILMLLLAGLALLLGTIGIYGVISRAVVERIPEIGIRMALGSSRREVASLIVGKGMRLTMTGIAIGLVCAFAVNRILGGMLFGIEPGDPMTYFSVALLLAGVTLLACWIPAHRASRVDPMEALRTE